MTKLLMFLLAFMLSCANPQSAKQVENKKASDTENTIATISAKVRLN